MILADSKIQEKIKKGELLLDEQGQEITSPIAKNISYDLSTKKFYSKELDKEGTETFILQPLGSVFVASSEIIKLPNNISAEVKLKYSLMTDGLMLDAPLYQPGHQGSNIFYRLTNISNKDIKLTTQKKYAYVVFHQTTEDVVTPYKGDFCDPQKSIKEIREHSYSGVYPDIVDDINRTRDKMNNAEKTIYGNVLVIITIFITLFSLLSSFFNASGGSISVQFSTTFLILGSIFSLVGAVCIVIDNGKSFMRKVVALWAAALIFFVLPFNTEKMVANAYTPNQATSSSQSDDSNETFNSPTELNNAG